MPRVHDKRLYRITRSARTHAVHFFKVYVIICNKLLLRTDDYMDTMCAVQKVFYSVPISGALNASSWIWITVYCIEKWLTATKPFSWSVSEINASVANMPFSCVAHVRRNIFSIKSFTLRRNLRRKRSECGRNEKKNHRFKRRSSVKMINGIQIAYGLFYYLFIKYNNMRGWCMRHDSDVL